MMAAALAERAGHWISAKYRSEPWWLRATKIIGRGHNMTEALGPT